MDLDKIKNQIKTTWEREPYNDYIARATIVRDLMELMKTLEVKYEIICDTTNNTPESIIKGELNVHLKPITEAVQISVKRDE